MAFSGKGTRRYSRGVTISVVTLDDAKRGRLHDVKGHTPRTQNTRNNEGTRVDEHRVIESGPWAPKSAMPGHNRRHARSGVIMLLFCLHREAQSSLTAFNLIALRPSHSESSMPSIAPASGQLVVALSGTAEEKAG